MCSKSACFSSLHKASRLARKISWLLHWWLHHNGVILDVLMRDMAMKVLILWKLSQRKDNAALFLCTYSGNLLNWYIHENNGQQCPSHAHKYDKTMVVQVASKCYWRLLSYWGPFEFGDIAPFYLCPFLQEISKNLLNEEVMWQRNFHFNHYLQTLGKSNLWGLSHFWGQFTLSSLSFMKFYD